MEMNYNSKGKGTGNEKISFKMFEVDKNEILNL